jgi:sulfoxide reductase heme-binding subunit YedZ
VTLWEATRAAGVVAYLLLTFVVVVGLALAGRTRVAPRFAVEDVHRFAGLLAAVFIWLHVLTVAVDTYVPFSFWQLLVPFTSSYRPLWTGLGIVAAELLLALAVTNALRKRIPYRIWRALHTLNLVVWAASTVHGIGAGTDRTQAWALTLYLVSTFAVLAAFASRSSAIRPKSTPSTHSPS